MALLEHARESERCPPSLLSAGETKIEDGFEEMALRSRDPTMPGVGLSTDSNVATDFAALLQMSESALKIPGDLEPDVKKAVLEYRRCILLAMVGSTPSTNAQLKLILSNGLLVVVKSWLGDILNGTFGGIDLLLHLLTCIADLPVTKTVVVDSGLGKAVGAIEKHKICVGSPNEVSIRERVQGVKDAWNASVKANKEGSSARKRVTEAAMSAGPSPKKAKTDAPSKKSASLSSLLSQVSTSSSKTGDAKKPVSNGSSGTSTVTITSAKTGPTQKDAPKKPSKRVKWADHFGGNLSSARMVKRDEFETAAAPNDSDSKVSWTDRKKRDRLREKELLARAKKSKLVDDDEDDAFNSNAVRMKASVPWHASQLLPPRAEVPPVQCDSKELTSQANRMSTVAPAEYLTEGDVPANPNQMSDVEQALDVAAQAAAVLETIPFFVAPQPALAPPVAGPAPSYTAPMPVMPQPVAAPPPAVTAPVAATPQMLQSMGLPLFLVGSNMQALQTLAATPSLLSTFVDANGMYDQTRLMSLVQTLSQSFPPPRPAAAPAYQMNYTQPSTYGNTQSYQQPATHTSSYGSYGPSSTATYGSTSSGGGYKGRSDAGNLHVSGYGPTTTQTDIVALFAPYVRVDEVVMKPTFSFVNTSDPDGAGRAREALQGAMLGGNPIRINQATRRVRTDKAPAPSSALGTFGVPAPSITPVAPAAVRNDAVPLPLDTTGQIDYNSVRDDRGNPATKNLFVAGYGSGTTEQDLRNTFGQHATVTAVIVKGNFSFVNTSDRVAAVHAREALMGAVLNGGVLRINFAKETGRLGTSFDLGYHGPGAGQTSSHYMRNPAVNY